MGPRHLVQRVVNARGDMLGQGQATASRDQGQATLTRSPGGEGRRTRQVVQRVVHTRLAGERRGAEKENTPVKRAKVWRDSVPQVDGAAEEPPAPFLCEWQGCLQAFRAPREVERHALAQHCPAGEEELPCLWAGCDGLPRRRFGLMTHVQDRHCPPQLLKLAAVRRAQLAATGQAAAPLPPAQPPAPILATAIARRHLLQFAREKEVTLADAGEGPVTRAIRANAALVLRNMATSSPEARRRLRPHQEHLATLAMATLDSSTAVAQILFHLAQPETSEPGQMV